MKGIKIKIKPLSVNEAYKGRRYRTPKYEKYIKDVMIQLKNIKAPEGDLMVCYEFGFTNKLADWDNPIKALQDILQKKHDFKDSKIYLGVGIKKIVNKGNEYINYSIIDYSEGKENIIKSVFK